MANFELSPAELARRFGICPTDARHRGDNSGALRSRSAGGLSSGFCAVGRRRRRCNVRGIVAIVVSILVAACEPPLPTGAVTRAPEPKPHYGLGISRDAFTSIIEKDDLPLPLEVWSRHDDPATSDALMARFHPEPGETPVSLGLWGKSDNLRAVDVECYTPIRGRLSKFEQEIVRRSHGAGSQAHRTGVDATKRLAARDDGGWPQEGGYDSQSGRRARATSSAIFCGELRSRLGGRSGAK